LSLAGHEVYECHDLRGLCFALKHQKPDVVFVEQSAIGPLDQTLRVIRGRHQSVPVLLLTGDRNLGLNPIRFGYYAVMPHPLDPEQLMVVTAHALAHHRMSLRIAELEVEASGHGFYGIVGRSAYARRLFHKLQSAAASDVHILLTGEPGTGKALTARAIHDRSARARGPFIALNGAKLSETAFSAEALMSATLGSTELRRNGALDDADRGTLYIAHIDKLNPRLQDQLLAALKNGSQSDFRLIASSEESLDQVVARGQFRNDLYAHIVQHPVQLMPLRSRPMDIEPTSRLMLEEISNELGRGRLSLAPRTLTVLERYSFPQNMTELRRILTAAVKLSASDIIEVDALPGELRHEPVPSVNSGAHSLPPDSKQQRHALLFELLAKAPMKMRDVERCAIEAALRRTEDNVTQAMRELGIGRTTLYRKLKKYGRR
jgi:DNA-binding NtrC family response regulator